MWKPGSRGGRPAVGPKVETRLPDDLLAKVDTFAAQRSMSRAEALRQLVDEGIFLAENSERRTIADGTITGQKIAPGTIQSGKPDPDEDPLYVHTLIVWALKKVGMSPAEADKHATAHQKHAVDAYRTAAEK